MNCRQIKELIPVYLDGELEDYKRSQVEAHLRDCVSCRKAVGEMETAWGMLGELADIEPDPNYMARFWAKASDPSSWYEKIIQQARGLFLQRRWVPALAATCIIIILAGVTMHSHLQTPEADTMVANLSEVDLDMVELIDIVENYDIIREIEFFSDLEIIENLDEFESS
ncbi:MAG: zf-HC2 domain-containing protein [Deltaproteobacteria bacterium]|nr:zf-HC2 domain-containing protein [Deltaproteobacteria bacterium]